MQKDSFQVGDSVWSLPHSKWGKIVALDNTNATVKLDDDILAVPLDLLFFDELVLSKKALQRRKFKPIKGQAYYYLADYEILSKSYFETDTDMKRLKFCNFFLSRKDAEKALIQMQKTAMEIYEGY
jgi:hypothetical protein